MTKLDALGEVLVRLFLRLDAAAPTDEALQRVAEFWRRQRKQELAPSTPILRDLPAELAARTCLVQKSPDPQAQWRVQEPGPDIAKLFSIRGDMAIDDADGRAAVRLRHLLDLVAERGEPYAAMFEDRTEGGGRMLIEAYAAPLSTGTGSVAAALLAASSRQEVA